MSADDTDRDRRRWACGGDLDWESRAAVAIRRQSNLKTSPMTAEAMPATAARRPKDPVVQLVSVVVAALKVVSVPAIAMPK